MAEKLIGHWKCEESENLDEFMKQNNVNFMLRKVANTIASYEEIRHLGEDEWMLHLTSTFKSSKLVFKLNVPFTETRLDGRKVTSEFRIEGDKLVTFHTPISKDDVPTYYERELLEDGRMLCSCYNDTKKVYAKRYYSSYQP